MSFISQPSATINLSGNLPRVVLAADRPVRLRLMWGDTVLLDERYTPNAQGTIAVDISAPIAGCLGFSLPESDTFVQPGLVGTFVLQVDEQEPYSFVVLRGGVHTLSVTPDVWLAANFLTWQEQQKPITANQPEWLTYYAGDDCRVGVKAYFSGNRTEERTLCALSRGKAYSLNVRYGRMVALFDENPLYYDVWVENDAVRLSYIQRYVLTRAGAAEQFYLFENSSGGIDTVRCTGELRHQPEYTSEAALMDDTEQTVQVDKVDRYRQNTGWLSRQAAAWLQDMFASPRLCWCHRGGVYPVVITEVAAESSSREHLTAYEFVFHAARKSPYLTVDRMTGDLPEPLEIIDPESTLFFLAPRLVDFPEIALSEAALLPVQSPFAPQWYRLSYGALLADMADKLTTSRPVQSSHEHANSALLDSLALENGYLYCGSDKIKSGYADRAAHAALADVATLAHRALIADNAILWSGRAFADWLDQPVRRSDTVVHRALSSGVFVSGFAGSGWELDADARLTVDSLTVRKQMDVYALQVNKIRATNGSIWVSDGAKIQSVKDEATLYRCYVDSDNNNNPVPFQSGDIVRCQQWTGEGTKYYTAKVDTVSNDSFTLLKSSFDGTGVPAPGDEPVRIGSASDTNRQGAIYLTASDNNAPYVDVIDGVVSSNLAGKTRVRLGKLSGITDAAFGGALSGYGLYADNVYLKGKIIVTGGNAATSQEVTTAVNNVAVGGRNYNLNFFGWVVGNLTKNYINNDYYKINASLINQRADGAVVSNTIKRIGEYICAVNVKTTGITTIYIDGRGTVINSSHEKYRNGIYFNLPAGFDERIVIYYTTNTLINSTWYIGIEGTSVTKSVELSYPKLELGNKATDWSPAPEDVEANAQAKVDALKNSLGALAWDSKVELAKLGTTLISGGYIRSELIEVNAIRISGGLATTAEVTTAVSNITVGGRNWVPGTSNGKDWTVGTWQGENTFKQTAAATNETKYINSPRFNLSAGEEIIVSFEHKEDPAIRIGDFLLLPDNYQSIGYLSSVYSTSSEWKKEVFKFIIPQSWGINRPLTLRIDHNGSVGGISASIWVKNIKLEKGNKPTDWSPAPEDVEANAQAKVDALKNSLGALAWDSKVELAKLGTTLIEGGYIKTNLINANAIKISGGLATTAEVTTAVSNVAVGGRNYNLNFFGWAVGNLTKNYINNDYYKINVSLINQNADGAVVSNTIKRIGEYICAVNVKTTGITTIYIDGRGSVVNSSHEKYRNGIYFNLPAGFDERIVIYYTTNTLINSTWYIGITGTSVTKSVELSYPKLELGNKPTDWSPAPEDVEANAQAKVDVLKNSLGALAWDSKVELAKLGSTLIEGGYLKTSLIDVNWLKANIINANYISALAVNFTAGTIGGFILTNVALISKSLHILSGTGQVIWKADGNPYNNQYMYLGGIPDGTPYNYEAIGFFQNCKQSNLHNVGLYVEARNSLTENTAIRMGGGCISGFGIKARRISTSQTLTHEDVYVTCENTVAISVTLAQIDAGKVIFIKRTKAEVTIIGGYASIQLNSGTAASIAAGAIGDTYMLVYDGRYWQYNILKS